MIAANPGPAVHMALLGAVVVIGLVVYAAVRIRRRREATQAEEQPFDGDPPVPR